MGDLLILMCVVWFFCIVFKAMFGGWKNNDYRRDR